MFSLSIGVRDVVFLAVVLLSSGMWAWWVLVAAVSVLLSIAVLRWQRMTWQVRDGLVIVDQGLLERSHREVPIDRIQQVELVRTLRHQVLGVATVRIETAGSSGGSEVELAVIPLNQAQVLRTELLSARDRARAEVATPAAADQTTPPLAPGDPRPDAPWPGAPTADAPVAGTPTAEGVPTRWAPPATDAPEQTLLRLRPARLALAGLTGPQLLALPVVILWTLSVLDDVPGGLDPDAASTGLRIVGVLSVVAFIALAWPVVAMIAGVLTYYDLTVTRTDRELRIRRGLLDRRDLSIPLARIQVVQRGEHPLLGAFGMVSLRVWSAGGESTQGASAATIPVLTPTEAAELLEVAIPGVSRVPPVERAPRRALPRSLVRGLALTAAATGIVAVLARPTLPSLGVWAAAATAVGLWWGLLRWRGLGAAVAAEAVAARSGAIIRQTSYVPTAKVQSMRVSASYFQRRRRLASAWVDVAGRRRAPGLLDRDDDEAHTAAGRLTSGAARRDEQATRRESGVAAGNRGWERPGSPWHDGAPVGPSPTLPP